MSSKRVNTTLGEVLELKRGYDLPKAKRKDGPVPIISSSGVSGCHNDAKAKAPGVVTGRYGTIGELFYLDEDYWPLNTALYVRDFKGNLPRFIYYFLHSVMFAQFSDKSSVPGVNRNHLHAIEVSFERDYCTQRAIAKILGDLDDKIDLLREMNRTLEDIARSVFRAWFVDFVPVRAKSAGATSFRGMPQALFDQLPETFVPSHIGEIPEGWTTAFLLDQANWVNGAAYKNMHFSNEPDALPVVKIAELKGGIKSNTKFTNTDLGAKYRLRTGDLTFSWSGSPKTSIDAFIWALGDAWLNQHIFAVRPNGNKSIGYLFALLKYLKPSIISIAQNKQTTGLGHITRKDMSRLHICEPPQYMINHFSPFADNIYNRILSNLCEIELLTAFRDALLPKLISGELPAPDLEALGLTPTEAAEASDGG